MKTWTINPAFLLVEASDVYFDEINDRWFSVPKHWIGDFVSSHSYSIKSRST
jgi:hypothetical protein